ncbi:17514_t:CDS:1, partial [Acaulospora colombiana]
MAQRAGIALGRIADNAPFVITRIDGAPHPPTIAEPVEHQLDGHSVAEMMATFQHAISFTTTSVDNGFAITYPLTLSKEERDALIDANDSNAHDHFHSFANDYTFHHSTATKQLRGHRVLFIDLTPGQVAASLCVGALNSGSWFYNSRKRKDIIIGNIENLTTQDVVDKLINPTKGNSASLNCIGILRPEGAFPNVSRSELEAHFPDTLVKWVSLVDLSRGIAMV